MAPNNNIPTIQLTEAQIPRQATFCKPAPFSTEPDAVAERDACDYAQRITVEMAKAGNCPRKVRIYTDGVFDLFHQGHARLMMQAKNLFPNSEVHLMIGANNDELTHKLKGRTVMTDVERLEAIRHCRYVDEIIPDAPWKLTKEFIFKHKIDFVAQDATPYVAEDCADVYGDVKKMGLFIATERTDGISTSDIVCRIVRDYDLYVRRNLQRGYTAKDLNVSFLKDKKFKLQNKLDEMKSKSKRKIEEVKEEFIQKWEDKSHDFIRTFLVLFGKDNLSQIWDKSKGKIKDALKRSPKRMLELTPCDAPRPKRMRSALSISVTSDESDQDYSRFAVRSS